MICEKCGHDKTMCNPSSSYTSWYCEWCELIANRPILGSDYHKALQNISVLEAETESLQTKLKEAEKQTARMREGFWRIKLEVVDNEGTTYNGSPVLKSIYKILTEMPGYQ